MFNSEGIPSPDAGRIRHDHGVPHVVTGKWGHTTVLELSRNPFAVGIQEFGRRSEGKHRRLGANGPRILNEGDIAESGRERIVFNPPDVTIEAPNGSEGSYDLGKWRAIQQMNDERGATRRGIPRATDLGKYPLSCRVIDITDNCGSIMFGRTSGKRKVYTCGRYMQYRECEHNQTDAEALLKFTLLRLAKYSLRGNFPRGRLRDLLLHRAQADGAHDQQNSVRPNERGLRRRRERLAQEHQACGRRMAIENDEARFKFIAGEFDRLTAELAAAEAAIATLPTAPPVHSPKAEVDVALELLEKIHQIIGDPTARDDFPALFKMLGLQIGLRFMAAIKGKTRTVRRLAGGVMGFGGADLPVRRHGDRRVEGPVGADVALTGQQLSLAVAQRGQESPSVCEHSQPEGPPGPQSSHQEGISFTKDNRGDRI